MEPSRLKVGSDHDRTATYADMFAALGAEPRLRILRVRLAAHPDGMVVGEIQNELGIAASTLSHHLEKLKNEELITVRRESTFLRYTANTKGLEELLGFLYAECCTRNNRYGLPTGRRRWLRHHGRPAGRGQRRDCTPCQHNSRRGHAGRADSDIRPNLRARFNPAVTLADASQGGLAWREVPVYIAAQIAGAFAGVAAAHLMFGEPVFFASRHVRAGGSQLFSEFVATFGLLSIIWGCARLHSSAVPFAVGAYITGAYWFTSSTSFANPAVTRSGLNFECRE